MEVRPLSTRTYLEGVLGDGLGCEQRAYPQRERMLRSSIRES